jgi:hypothetical protein
MTARPRSPPARKPWRVPQRDDPLDVLGRIAGASWSQQAFVTRPVFYTYPAHTRDPRLDRLRFSGLYLTLTRHPSANVDLYGLVWRDGPSVPAADRRALYTVGGRVFGRLGASGRADYEVDTAAQGGSVGRLQRRAWFQHSQIGYAWPRALWDYASGDADPTDSKSGAFDALLGTRRSDLGPGGLQGLLARSNLVSPGVSVVARPTATLETGLHVRGVWLAEARDEWRPSGLVDATGGTGRSVGTQTEVRVRYRIIPSLEFDGAVTMFDEGRFVRALRPSTKGRATHVYAGFDVRR